jgi:nucleotidyltransferase/DNA polymerase involved in DNA repair
VPTLVARRAAPYEFEQYRQVSDTIYALFGAAVGWQEGRMEAVSCDEVYLDISELPLPNPAALAAAAAAAVSDKTTSSADVNQTTGTSAAATAAAVAVTAAVSQALASGIDTVDGLPPCLSADDGQQHGEAALGDGDAGGSPALSPLSWTDGTERMATAWVRALRAAVVAAVRCPVSAGVGPNKLVARLATARAKPNGPHSLLDSRPGE